MTLNCILKNACDFKQLHQLWLNGGPSNPHMNGKIDEKLLCIHSLGYRFEPRPYPGWLPVSWGRFPWQDKTETPPLSYNYSTPPSIPPRQLRNDTQTQSNSLNFLTFLNVNSSFAHVYTPTSPQTFVYTLQF